MPVFQLNIGLIIVLDFVVWLFLSIVLPLWAFKKDVDSFRSDSLLYRTRKWERNGLFYEKVLFVKVWKPLLPDGAKPFKGGFEKKRMKSREPGYLDEFIKESCRAELTHWLLIYVSPVFFLWNPPIAGFIIIGYAVAANLPCIVTQRYNRPRFVIILEREKRRMPDSGRYR